MNKFWVLILFLIISPIIGGLYGGLHDQFTYTISPEYYTKFKFYQFGLMDMGNEAIFPNPRIEVFAVGFMATWWMGLPIGLILGLVGLVHSEWKDMFNVTIKAIIITITVAFITGLIGLGFGYFFLSNQPITEFENWYLPENLVDYKNFIRVGSMHNFSYLGGLIGLISGIIYSIKEKNRLKNL
ncbi:MAG: hypothetical protein K1X92_07355 [Bacteroidia bacterium]|nr:hypothetical protein [Bacteroidia bacterium]